MKDQAHNEREMLLEALRAEREDRWGGAIVGMLIAAASGWIIGFLMGWAI